MNKKQVRRFICVGLGLLVSLPIIFVGYAWLTHRPISFDSQEWKEGDDLTRGRMVRDMRRSIDFIEKTKSEVINILGEADYEKKAPTKTVLMYSISGELCSGPKTAVRYCLIPWGGFFVVEFDSNDVCVKEYVDD